MKKCDIIKCKVCRHLSFVYEREECEKKSGGWCRYLGKDRKVDNFFSCPLATDDVEFK